MPSKILISSDSLLNKIRNCDFKPDEFYRVIVNKEKKQIHIQGKINTVIDCETKDYGNHLIPAESFVGLIRILKQIHDQPITLLFDSHITVKDIMI